MTDPLLPAVVLTALAALAAALASTGPSRVRRRLRLRLEQLVGQRVGHGLPSQEEAARLDHLHGFDAGQHATSRFPRTGLADTAMMLELIGAMLDAGAGVGRSLQLVAESASAEYSLSLRPVVSALAIGADWDTAWRSSAVRSPELLELRDALGFAALTGAPSSAILYAQAARMRRERFRGAEKRAAALGVKLVIPLGLCSLPAFVCLGVVPVLLAMIPSAS